MENNMNNTYNSNHEDQNNAQSAASNKPRKANSDESDHEDQNTAQSANTNNRQR
ncbi:hypothetical protein [Clostridium aminobutyricum]|uniref:Uncharacterized protein n=1 Tax=Clostridium aminobutyricum TaxID=33953 RepID=A0A939D7E4_CLOAM|nr:hypothetical protein [Clostridium aminobutyricum]MBN7772461.1 hypothetical protein [Clostridium aminobutyricum]